MHPDHHSDGLIRRIPDGGGLNDHVPDHILVGIIEDGILPGIIEGQVLPDWLGYGLVTGSIHDMLGIGVDEEDPPPVIQDKI